MKKSLLLLLVAGSTCVNLCSAQLSQGGIPLSFAQAEQSPSNEILVVNGPSKDAFLKLLEDRYRTNPFGPAQIGMNIPVSLNFPESGSFHYLPSGDMVWSAQLKITDAPAIGLYYDNFALPKGVNFFLFNNNRKQILGAYTSENQSPVDTKFGHEAILGDVVNLELNIPAGTNVDNIKLNVGSALVYFSSFEYLSKYASSSEPERPTDADLFNLEGSGSPCMINAICPDGSDYAEFRKATLQTLSAMGEACSGTMVNVAGNTEANCKKYMLTATHCDQSGSTTDAAFSTLLLRYNFEKLQCTGSTVPAEVFTLTGAYFRARSAYTSSVLAQNIVADFLLLEPISPIPAAWNINLAGWDRSASFSTVTGTKKYIGFHHPDGDIKKLSFSQSIANSGSGTNYPANYFALSFPSNRTRGGVSTGSSGSGLSNGDGRIIGIASTAGDPLAECTSATYSYLKFVNYSKLSTGWEFNSSNSQQLKHWLDPNNTNVITTNTVTSACKTIAGQVSINSVTNDLEQSLVVYPNPVTSGLVALQTNFKEPSDLVLEVYNLAGAKVASYTFGRVTVAKQLIDLSSFANGMYLLKFNSGGNQFTKKIMLTK